MDLLGIKGEIMTFTEFLIKVIKFFFKRDTEIAPGVYLRGRYCENINAPTTEPPLNLKK